MWWILCIVGSSIPGSLLAILILRNCRTNAENVSVRCCQRVFLTVLTAGVFILVTMWVNHRVLSTAMVNCGGSAYEAWEQGKRSVVISHGRTTDVSEEFWHQLLAYEKITYFVIQPMGAFAIIFIAGTLLLARCRPAWFGRQIE